MVSPSITNNSLKPHIVAIISCLNIIIPNDLAKKALIIIINLQFDLITNSLLILANSQISIIFPANNLITLFDSLLSFQCCCTKFNLLILFTLIPIVPFAILAVVVVQQYL